MSRLMRLTERKHSSTSALLVAAFSGGPGPVWVWSSPPLLVAPHIFSSFIPRALLPQVQADLY